MPMTTRNIVDLYKRHLLDYNAAIVALMQHQHMSYNNAVKVLA